MISFGISMWFISFCIAIAMLVGFGLVKACEKSVDDKDPSMSMGARMIIDEYNRNNVFGRMAVIFIYGVRVLSVPFTIKGGK